MKKTGKMIFAAIATGLMTFGMMGCDNNDDTSTTIINPPDTGDTIPQKPSTEPGLVLIDGGDWMYTSGKANVVIHVDVAKQEATMYRFSGLGAYVRYKTEQTALDGDIITKANATKDWFYYGGWKAAYNFNFEGSDLWMWENDMLYTKHDVGSSSTTSVSLLEAATISNWTPILKSVPGTYSSVVAINNENKYLYAVIAETDKKLSLYVCDSATVTDFSSLTPKVTIDMVSFNLHQLLYTDDNWTVLVKATVTKSGSDYVLEGSPSLTVTKNTIDVSSVTLAKK